MLYIISVLCFIACVCVYMLSIYFIFFFKQKTAYEMRISDWSSDVCSSDLKEPQWRSVIALPDFPRYRDLHAETAGSLAAAQIEVWWVDQAGAVQRPCRPLAGTPAPQAKASR